MSEKARLARIMKHLPQLTEYQLDVIDKIIRQLQQPKIFWYNPTSDLVNFEISQDFGDALRIHHVFSAEALSKDRFEYALERVLKGRGVTAERSSRGNPGHDITIRNETVSLKTQANKDIKEDRIHISKFMELGKGVWTDQLVDLAGLLCRFYTHMERYDRIFILRRLRNPSDEVYELVEIPKSLLERAKEEGLKVDDQSKQYPKPGYCSVIDEDGVVFQLYFDGGTERKLQVRGLRKSFCIVHATWRFPRQEADKIAVPDKG